MNNRNDMVSTPSETDEYIDKMVKNARKHGLILQVVVADAPMVGMTVRKVVLDSLRNMGDINRMIDDVDYIARLLHEARDKTDRMSADLLDTLKKARKLAEEME